MSQQAEGKKMLTPSQAAAIIGCSDNNVRTLIKAGKLRGRVTSTPWGSVYYLVREEDARAYASTVQTRGWPRGKARP